MELQGYYSNTSWINSSQIPFLEINQYGSLGVIPKTIPQVVGEYLLRPALDLLSSRVFRVLQDLTSTLQKVNHIFSFPTAYALKKFTVKEIGEIINGLEEDADKKNLNDLLMYIGTISDPITFYEDLIQSGLNSSAVENLKKLAEMKEENKNQTSTVPVINEGEKKKSPEKSKTAEDKITLQPHFSDQPSYRDSFEVHYQKPAIRHLILEDHQNQKKNNPDSDYWVIMFSNFYDSYMNDQTTKQVESKTSTSAPVNERSDYQSLSEKRHKIAQDKISIYNTLLPQLSAHALHRDRFEAKFYNQKPATRKLILDYLPHLKYDDLDLDDPIRMIDYVKVQLACEIQKLNQGDKYLIDIEAGYGCSETRGNKN